ncbi:MAG: flagellar hook protein FlgE [Burkholderiales bacterium]|nr:flagellar hook protein FlgE [Burkholderiales bacterium]
MGFQQGLSGLNAAARNLDVIGNNVANANTVGFKAGNALFADVYANAVSGSSGMMAGIGTTLAAIQQDHAQGNISVSTNPLDMAINGNGFFRMSQNGAVSYSRNGQFHLDKDGYIVNAQGARLTGYPAGPNGTVVASTPGDLQVSAADIDPSATTEAGVGLNLDSRKTAITAAFNLNDPATYHHATSMSVYDSLGNEHTLSMYFVKTAANTWSVFAANDGAQVGTAAVGTLNFDSSGNINSSTTTLPFSLSLPLTTGATTPMTVDLDFTGSTQFGSIFGVNELTQDGYASGRLTGFNISGDGTIMGRYSNGQSRAQGQVTLATFTNLHGLQPLGGNLYAESAASGQPIVGVPQSGSLGVLQAGAVEDSNVDLTAELVDMITAQRVYQANAQTIKTQDAVLQTLVNLR